VVGPEHPGSTRAEREAWASAVADELVAVSERDALRPGHPRVIHDCWIGQEDLALYVRFGYADRPALGNRFADIHVNRVEGLVLPGFERQAFYLYHDMFGDKTPLFVDKIDCPWFGDEPEVSWERAVEGQGRLYTAWPQPEEPATWAEGVAVALVEHASAEASSRPMGPTLQDCWVGEDLALYVRYRYADKPVAHRAAEIGPNTVAPDFTRTRKNAALRVWHELGGSAPPAYVDEQGYAWSGDAPGAPVTWAYVIERMPRTFTVPVTA
jgi:hypothetical protein